MYQAAEDYNGRVTINYAIQDSEGGMTLASYYFEVVAVDDAPEQISQNTLVGFTKEEEAITITRDHLLSSIIDRDTDKSKLTISNVSVNDEAGSISNNQNGTWTFTPGQEVSGSIQLSYFVNDDDNELNAKASIEVLATNDIPALTGNPAILQTGKEDTEYTISANDLLQGYTDGDASSSLEITALTTTGGILEEGIDGKSWKLIPNKDQTGNVLLSYVIGDGEGGFVLGSTSFELLAVNDAPELVSGNINRLSVLEDSGVTSLGLEGINYGPGGGQDELSQTLTYRITSIPDSEIGEIQLSDGTAITKNSEYSIDQLRGLRVFLQHLMVLEQAISASRYLTRREELETKQLI